MSEGYYRFLCPGCGEMLATVKFPWLLDRPYYRLEKQPCPIPFRTEDSDMIHTRL